MIEQTELTRVLACLQRSIADDYRATIQEPDDTLPMVDITIACDEDGDGFAYQTGDNSFAGDCYGFPVWAVSTLSREDNPAHVAAELLAQLREGLPA